MPEPNSCDADTAIRKLKSYVLRSPHYLRLSGLGRATAET
jgi:hypothetical protein